MTHIDKLLAISADFTARRPNSARSRALRFPDPVSSSSLRAPNHRGRNGRWLHRIDHYTFTRLFNDCSRRLALPIVLLLASSILIPAGQASDDSNEESTPGIQQNPKPDPTINAADAAANDANDPANNADDPTNDTANDTANPTQATTAESPEAIVLDQSQARELLEHLDELWRGASSYTELKMTVQTRRYRRTLELEAWSRGKEETLVVVRKPIRDRGVATLKSGNNIWNYLPKINRVTKLPSSMQSGSWMGSHFTNDDLVKESSFLDDYTAQVSIIKHEQGNKIYHLVANPTPEATVVWGRVIFEVDADTLMPIQAQYLDEDYLLARTMTFGEIRRIEDRWVPMRLKLIPADKPNEFTIVEYSNLSFDISLDKDFFSLKSLLRQ